MRSSLSRFLLSFAALALIVAGAGATPSPAAAERPEFARSPGAHERAAGPAVERIDSALNAAMDQPHAPASSVIPTIAGRVTADQISAGPDLERHQPGARCEWIELALGSEATGRLEAGDCAYGMLDGSRDPSFADQYVVETTERGELNVTAFGDVDIDVEVRDMAFAALANMSEGSGTTADLRLTLPAGEYLIIIRPSSFAAGVETDYSLSTAFTAEPEPGPCQTQALSTDGPVADSLGGPSACRVFDHLPAVLLDSFGDLWSIDVESAAVLSIEMSATDFSPLLILMDESLTYTLISDASGLEGDPDPLRSTVSAHVSPGRYHVLAAGTFVGGAGDYVLNADVEPIESGRCEPLDIGIGEVVNGTLDSADCRLSYTAASLFDQTNVDLLQVMVPQLGTLRVVLEGDGITPTVRLLDTDLRPLLGGWLVDDDVVTFDIAGPVIIAVQALEGTPGGYRAEFQFTLEGEAACSLQTIGPSETIDGELSEGDCTLEDYGPIADSSRVDLYVVRLPSRGRLTVDMRSDAIDTYLWIVAGFFEYSLQNDDADDETTDSRISAILPAGDYVIVANSNLPEIGAYSLSTAFEPLPAPSPCPISSIGPNETVAGAIGPGDCLASDLDSTRYSASPVRRYELDLDARGRLDVHVASDTFFPKLILRDPASGRPVTEDADEDRFVREASVGLIVGPGTYWLEIEEADGLQDSEGAFTLTTTFLPQAAPMCDVTEVAALPASFPGSIDESDCLLRDRIGDYAQNAVDEYTFTLARRGTLTIDLLSEDWDLFDPYLELHDFRYTVLAANDDSVDEFALDARIEINVGPGRYRALAMGALLLGGDYDIEIAFDPDPFEPGPTPDPSTSPTTSPTISPTTGPIEPTPTPGPGTVEPTPTRRPIDPDDTLIYLPSTESNR